jgi:MFS family permease
MAYNGFMLGMGGILVFNVFSQLPKYFGLMVLFYLCVVVALIGATWLRVAVKDRLPERTVKKGNLGELVRTVRKSLALKVGYGAVLVTRADTMILGTLVMVWAVESARSQGLTPLQGTAVGGTALGVMMIVSVCSNPILGPMIDRFGRVPIIILGLLSGTIGFILLAVLENPFTRLLWLPVTLIGAAGGSVAIASNALCADAAPRPLLGTVMGGKNTMAPIGTIIFLQLAGFLFDKFGPSGAFLFKAAINFAALAWILLVRKGVVIDEQPEAAQVAPASLGSKP